MFLESEMIYFSFLCSPSKQHLILLSCIGLYWLAWVVKESFMEDSGIENNFICQTCGHKGPSLFRLYKQVSWQKELAQGKPESRKKSLERISKLILGRPQHSTDKLSLQTVWKRSLQNSIMPPMAIGWLLMATRASTQSTIPLSSEWWKNLHAALWALSLN